MTEDEKAELSELIADLSSPQFSEILWNCIRAADRDDKPTVTQLLDLISEHLRSGQIVRWHEEYMATKD